MSTRLARRATYLLVLLGALAAPATAAAYRVTVHVHGAGKVEETTDRKLMNCTVPTLKSDTSVTDCVAGTPDGHYSWGDIVELHASVPTTHAARGWQLTGWESTTAAGRVNCDDDQPVSDCRFQIFDNLRVDLYFDDTAGPQDTSISSGPATPTNSTSATFNFNSGDPDAGYECRLEKPGETIDWYGCGTTTDKTEDFSNLSANGMYTFRVRAKDPSGNLDATPAVWTWTVDTVAPVASITGLPAPDTVTRDTTVALNATGEGTLTCTFDGAASPCSLSRDGLGDGPHTFTARARDAAGNTGPTATRSWRVDTTGPVLTITAAPPALTNQTSAAFEWTANEATSRFECQLGDGAWTECQSGKGYSGLPDGEHTFSVRGFDGIDNPGPAVQRSWTVETVPPETTLLGGPADGSTSAQQRATFEFASPESGTSFECRLDGAEFAACASPLTLDGLANDDHVFEVRARDAAGNVDASPERRAWRVNSLDGDADGVNRPADCRDDDPAIRPGAEDVPGDGVDQDCSGTDSAVPAPPAPPADDDKDDDGVDAGLDCDDGNPSVRPGANDIPADGIDQDCAGGDAAFPVTSAALTYNFKATARRTRVLRMVLSKIAIGATVKVTCKGRACPIKTKRVKPRKGKVDVRRLLRRRPLRAGNVLTLTITQPGHVSKTVRFRARRGKSPAAAAFRCRAPGAKKLTRCP